VIDMPTCFLRFFCGGFGFAREFFFPFFSFASLHVALPSSPSRSETPEKNKKKRKLTGCAMTPPGETLIPTGWKLRLVCVSERRNGRKKKGE